jgi:hypothetical protein
MSKALPPHFKKLRSERLWEYDISHLSEPTAFNDGYSQAFADLLPEIEALRDALLDSYETTCAEYGIDEFAIDPSSSLGILKETLARSDARFGGSRKDGQHD